MRRMTYVLAALVAGLLLGAPATHALTVRVQSKPTVGSSVGINISASPLPNGGYYYGVLVLRPYRGYTRAVPPACASSSDMERTDYGYPQPSGLVTLALTPARSDTHHWCHGGSYEGAVYAVPHAPPCEATYPCRAEPYEASPCWNQEGRPVCGVVAPAAFWRYPDPLPQPLAAGTNVVARFSIKFPARTVQVLDLSATVYNVNQTLDHVITSHESLTQGRRHIGQDYSRCTPEGTAARCTGKYALASGTITFAGTVPLEGRTNRLTITGGTGRYRHAEGTILTEYNAKGTHARETLTFER